MDVCGKKIETVTKGGKKEGKAGKNIELKKRTIKRVIEITKERKTEVRNRKKKNRG